MLMINATAPGSVKMELTPQLRQAADYGLDLVHLTSVCLSSVKPQYTDSQMCKTRLHLFHARMQSFMMMMTLQNKTGTNLQMHLLVLGADAGETGAMGM